MEGRRDTGALFPNAEVTMNRFLREGVHGVVIDSDLALLDIDDDAYLCVPDAGRGCARTEGGVLAFRPGPVADTLADAGLLADRPGQAVAIPPLPSRSIIHSTSTLRLEAGDLLACFGVCRDLRSARRDQGLRPFLDLAAGPASPSGEFQASGATAALFWRLAPWLPIEGECLVRSAMLVSFLRRKGLRADWVFGVRLWPFAAHCWVQEGDVCLNDDFERLGAFTPILVR